MLSAIPALAQTLPECSPTTIESIVDDAPSPSTRGDAGVIRTEPTGPIEVVVEDTNCEPFVYPMLSPYRERPQVISVFATDRPDGRLHKGADIAAPKLTPVYAVSSGVVTWILDERGGDCCAVAIAHSDGWTSYYIHLNNDTFGTDDGQGYGMAPGIEIDAEVDAGQLIGWVGDSGNAEETPSHVHFELRMPGNIAVDPVASLAQAALPSSFALSSLSSYTEPFSDDDGLDIEPILGRLASLGLISGCGEPVGTRFCPEDPASGDDAVTFIQSFLGVTIDPTDALSYPDLGVLETRAALEQDSCLVSYCGENALTVSEVTALLEYAAESTAAVDGIEALETMPKMVIGRCEDLNINDIETRAELAIYLAQEVGLLTSVPCGTLK